MTVRAVAWDVDGTLIDSEPIHLRALLAVCAEAGVDLSDLPDDEFVGVALPMVWQAIGSRFSGMDEADWTCRINAAYCAEIGTLRTPTDARSAIRKVAAFGLAQAAVSNSHRAIVVANLDALGVADGMAAVVALEDVDHPKPDPEPYVLAARKLGVSPAQMIAVEDSATGAASARAAGCRVIGLSRGSLHLPGAHQAAASLAEVVSLVRSAASLGEK